MILRLYPSTVTSLSSENMYRFHSIIIFCLHFSFSKLAKINSLLLVLLSPEDNFVNFVTFLTNVVGAFLERIFGHFSPS